MLERKVREREKERQMWPKKAQNKAGGRIESVKSGREEVWTSSGHSERSKGRGS
jgi:hypothetical protein